MSRPEEKHALQQALEDAGLCVHAYGGRAMYGRRCLAVDGSLQQIVRAIVVAVTEVEPEAQEDIVRALEQDWLTDSMGRDEVVYWPLIAHVANKEFCEFEECDQRATEERGSMSYCPEHAEEHDELVRIDERERADEAKAGK